LRVWNATKQKFILCLSGFAFNRFVVRADEKLTTSIDSIGDPGFEQIGLTA